MAHIKETSGTDLTPYIKTGESVYLRTGRSNTVRVDEKLEVHDVRAIHFNGENGEHVELIVYRDLNSPSDSIYVYNVSRIVVTSVYWGKKIDYDNL